MCSFVVVCLVALAAVTSVQSDRSSMSPVDTLPPKNVPDTPLSYAGKETHPPAALSALISSSLHSLAVCVLASWLIHVENKLFNWFNQYGD